MATLRELDVKAGDVARNKEGAKFTVGRIGSCVAFGFTTFPGGAVIDGDFYGLDGLSTWEIAYRASDAPKTWGEMTDAEKGALLLANQEGKVIECLSVVNWHECSEVVWDRDCAYRIKPEPVCEVVTLEGANYGKEWGFDEHKDNKATHRITFETIDGRPDCSTIKMEPLTRSPHTLQTTTQ